MFLDDWASEVIGITVSIPLVNENSISIYPNPTSNYINIAGS